MTAPWRAFVLDEGAYAECPWVNVVTDDDRQVRLMSTAIPATATAEDILTDHGWRVTGEWEPGSDGRHAPVRRAGRGRPPRGLRVETKLAPDEVAQVEGLIGHLGADRSEVVAALIRRGLADYRAEEDRDA